MPSGYCFLFIFISVHFLCCYSFFFIPSNLFFCCSHPFYLATPLHTLFSFSLPHIFALILSLCHCLLSLTPLTD